MVDKLDLGLLDSNVYLIGNTLIDTGLGNSKKLEKELLKRDMSLRDISKIILTHEHHDHSGGVRLFRDFKNVSVLAHKDVSEEKLSDYFVERPFYLKVNVPLADNDRLRIGDRKFFVIHTPAHTEGSICLYDPEKKELFTGDLLPRRVDKHFIHNKDKLLDSLKKLSNLNVEKIYPGHGDMIYNGDEYIKGLISEIKNL